jgi:hypothetical protein
MRQAIHTKFMGPTNTRGSRVKAKADAGSITLGWNHALNVGDNHAAAAKALALKLGWTGHWHGGGLPGSGYAFVMASDAGSLFAIWNDGKGGYVASGKA